jgi:prophage regulatory protein
MQQGPCSPSTTDQSRYTKTDGEAPDRIVREAECALLSGLSRTTRWRLERAGKFPKRRQISPNCVGWLCSEVMTWLRERADPAVA